MVLHRPVESTMLSGPRTGVERPLPHSSEAERAILGAILLGTPNVADTIDSLRESGFFIPVHQLIFRHMKALRERNKPLDDVVVLYESLRGAEELEAAGGSGYLSDLPSGLPRVCNIEHYIGIIKQKAEIRLRLYILETVHDKLLSLDGDAERVLREAAILSAPLMVEVGHNRILKFRSGAEIAMETNEPIEWIVPGFVVKGGITELGAKVKAGKTTLILKLVRAVADGAEFLGRPTRKTPTVYLTEQPIVSFRQAMERAGLLGRGDFQVLQHGETRGMPWGEVASEAIDECKRIGAILLVVDTLPHFAGLKGDSENNSGDALQAMQPLLRAAAAGIGTLLSRHERKSGGEVGDSSRGSSAFAGAADILLSLRRPEGNARKTQRVIQAISRFPETPGELLIELTDDSYVSLGEPGEAAVKEAKAAILGILPTSESEAVDLKALMKSAKVSRATAQRATKELLEDGTLNRTGEGKRGNPLRFFKTQNPFCPTSITRRQKETIEENRSPS